MLDFGITIDCLGQKGFKKSFQSRLLFLHLRESFIISFYLSVHTDIVADQTLERYEPIRA